jgi:16S rRNA (uracil1498-N3)-methyltransferase
VSLRLHVALPLAQLQAGSELALPPGAARHAQVRRVQPGHSLCLFDGSGSDWQAEVLSMGRSEVRVRLGMAVAVPTELPFDVLLAVGMPANERMDMLVEKASELGVTHIQPLLTERSVLRLEGERAQRKRDHWQGIAIAACEQCGRSRVPHVAPVAQLRDWLPQAGPGCRLVLSLAPGAALPGPASGPIISLSGPEGGLSASEEDVARLHGFLPTALGPRILRADTAPLALLAYLGLSNAA